MKNTAPKLALVTASIALALVSFTAPNAEARHENELIRLSHSLEDIASELRDEFREHYRHTAAYRHLVSDAAKIEAEAEHIHRLAHDPVASLRHIAADVEDLDDLAHHLHELVDRTETGRYGHVHGSTRHVHEMMTALNEVLHAMEAEVAALRRPAPCTIPSRHFDSHSSYSGHGFGHHREGVSFQRGGFRLSIYR